MPYSFSARVMRLSGALAVVLVSYGSAVEPLLTVIVSRHGIRTPFAPPGSSGNLTAATIETVTAQPFPAAWPPGPHTSEVWGTSDTAGLTPHGQGQIRAMGAWMGAEDFAHLSCHEVALYSDTASKRDNDTAVAWAAAAFPDCPALHSETAIREAARGELLFNTGGDQSLCSFPSLEVREGMLGGRSGGFAALRRDFHRALAQVQEVLECCPAALCGDLGSCSLEDLAIEPSDASELSGAATQGAVQQAAYWASFFVLEYLNNHSEWAAGRLTAEEVVDLYDANVEHMALSQDSIAAPRFAGDLAVHIVASLVQAAGRPGTAAAAAALDHDAATRVVYMAGHDTNLLLLQQLLGLHWRPLGWSADTLAPGSMLIFELTQAEDGPRVEAWFQVATPEQQRNLDAFSQRSPPSRVAVGMPCESPPSGCRLDDFVEFVASRVDVDCMAFEDLRRFLQEALPRERSWLWALVWTLVGVVVLCGAALVGMLLVLRRKKQPLLEASATPSAVSLQPGLAGSS